MSVPTFHCPSGDLCFAPECCAHQQCMHLEESQVPIVPMPLSPDRQRFRLAAETFFKLFPGRIGCAESDPEMVILFELMDKVAAAVQAEEPTSTEPAPQETPFSECQNPECPVGCPDSHAETPKYLAMVNEPAPASACDCLYPWDCPNCRVLPEPDEPVVQEVPRG